MAKLLQSSERLSDAQLRANLKEQTNLPQDKIEILVDVVKRAYAGFEEITTTEAIRTTKDGLKRFDKALARLEKLMTEDKEVIAALKAYNSNGAFGFLLSSGAAMHINGYLDGAVNPSEVRNLLSKTESRNDLLSLSDLDELAIAKRQHQLSGKNLESLMLMFEHTRYSIKGWLSLAGQDAGGQRVQTEREMVVFFLAGRAEEILGSSPTSTEGGPFVNLCADVLGALNMPTKGLEDVVKRSLRKLRKFLNPPDSGKKAKAKNKPRSAKS